MKIISTKMEGLYVGETNFNTDDRGSFSRLFCKQDLSLAIGNRDIVQINLSQTKTPGVIRGIHFQYSPHAEMKLVRCVKGRSWDLVVDLRAGSPTFMQWHAEELSPQNARMMIIPEGFAHGFQALEHDSELLYLHTAFHTPDAEGGILYNDPQLQISWPLPVANLSDRDKSYPLIPSDFCGIKL